MCEQPLYAAMLKDEYDKKFIRTGVRTQMRIIGSVSKIGNINNAYKVVSPEFYNVFVKECGKCRTCRFKQASQKAAQCYCESKLHKKNCFVTLTFSDNDLYHYARTKLKLSYYLAKKFMHFHTWTLENDLFTKYFKAFRMTLYRNKLKKWLFDNNKQYILYKKDRYGAYKVDENGNFILYESPDYAIKKYIEKTGIQIDYPKPDTIKLLHVGEYGSLKNRPHHHYICLGYSPDDIYEEKYYRDGKVKFRKRSKLHDKLWCYGASSIDDCTYQSINYVSRYCTKKIVGEKSESWYEGRKPEYITCSTSSGGLGKQYFLDNYKSLVARGSVPIPTKKGILNVGLPRYFRRLLKEIDFPLYQDYVSKQIDKMSDLINNLKTDNFLPIYSKSLDSQTFKTLRVLKSLSRSLERSNDDKFIDSVEKRMHVAGIPKHLFEKYRDCYGRYVDRISYKTWCNKYNNEKLHKKVVDFEQYRKKWITRYRNIGQDNIADMYERINNPYKTKGYCSQYYDIDDKKCVFDSYRRTGEILYA